MYYANGLGEERNLIAEADELLDGRCFDYSLDRCLWPEGWKDQPPDIVPPYPNCDLLVAAMNSDPEAFDALTEAMPYCTYDECKAPHETRNMAIGLAAVALGVGLLIGAWVI
jgi:hypothetical protein